MSDLPGVPTQKTECPACKAEVYFSMPQISMVNQLQYSMVVVLHDKVEKCPNCRKMFICAIRSVEEGGKIDLWYLEVKPKQEGSAITSPIYNPQDGHRHDAKLIIPGER